MAVHKRLGLGIDERHKAIPNNVKVSWNAQPKTIMNMLHNDFKQTTERRLTHETDIWRIRYPLIGKVGTA